MDNGPIDDSHLVDAAEYREDCKERIANQLLIGGTVTVFDLQYDIDDVFEDMTCMNEFRARFSIAQLAFIDGRPDKLSALYHEAADRIAENIVDEYIEYQEYLKGEL